MLWLMFRTRFPLATVAVVVVTAVPSLLQFVIPALEPALMRDPAAIRAGEWWRLGTALVVQDGGPVGTATNLIFLAALAFLAERALGPGRMLLLYATGAIVGEATGFLLDVAGAGNSIAVCGLAGGLGVACFRGRADLLAGSMASFYALILAASGPFDWVGTIVAAVLGSQLVAQREKLPRWIFAAVPAIAGVVLASTADMHGPPLLAGMIVGWLSTAASRSTSTPTTPV